MWGGDHSYPGVHLVAWNDTKEKIFVRPIWNYSQLLSYPWDICDHVSIKLPRLLRDNNSVGSFFQPQNTLNFIHGLSYLGILHLLVPLPLSESKDQE